jgi:hypothetical protein
LLVLACIHFEIPGDHNIFQLIRLFGNKAESAAASSQGYTVRTIIPLHQLSF